MPVEDEAMKQKRSAATPKTRVHPRTPRVSHRIGGCKLRVEF